MKKLMYLTMCLVFVGSAVAGLAEGDADLIIRPATVVSLEYSDNTSAYKDALVNSTALLNSSGMTEWLFNGSSRATALATYHGTGITNGYFSQNPLGGWGDFFDDLSGDTDIDIVLDLGADYTMDEIIFWQALWTSIDTNPQPGSAAKTIDVRINTEAQGSTAFSGTATTATLDNSYGPFGGYEKCSPAQAFLLDSATTGRYVQLSITDNFGGPRVTLGEVRLVSAIPEPATLSLLVFGTLALLRKRK